MAHARSPGGDAKSVTIEFSTSRYERLHGRKPRGYGLWYFRMPDGRTFAHPGYYVSRRAVKAHARHFAVDTVMRVQVCGLAPSPEAAPLAPMASSGPPHSATAQARTLQARPLQ
jgi:hypothetical protein